MNCEKSRRKAKSRLGTLWDDVVRIICYCIYGEHWRSNIPEVMSQEYLPGNQMIDNGAEVKITKIHKRKKHNRSSRQEKINEEKTDSLCCKPSVALLVLPGSPGGARRLIGSRYLSHVSRFGDREFGSRPVYCHPLSMDIICHDEASTCSDELFPTLKKSNQGEVESMLKDDHVF